MTMTMKPTPTAAPQKANPQPQNSIIITKQFIPPQPPAAPDFFSKMSLLSYVTSFKDEKSFNETDLFSLGINMKEKEPMLPMLHSVLSDAPLSSHSVYPTPKSYADLSTNEDPVAKIGLFKDQILFFIFYTQPKTEMQAAAYKELEDRGYSYDEDKGIWLNSDGAEWDVNQWKLIEPTISPNDE